MLRIAERVGIRSGVRRTCNHHPHSNGGKNDSSTKEDAYCGVGQPNLAGCLRNHGPKALDSESPVEIVLDQIRKQEERVAELQEQLDREKRDLERMQKAKDFFETK